jgi:hypothetical protein
MAAAAILYFLFIPISIAFSKTASWYGAMVKNLNKVGP